MPTSPSRKPQPATTIKTCSISSAHRRPHHAEEVAAEDRARPHREDKAQDSPQPVVRELRRQLLAERVEEDSVEERPTAPPGTPNL